MCKARTLSTSVELGYVRKVGLHDSAARIRLRTHAKCQRHAPAVDFRHDQYLSIQRFFPRYLPCAPKRSRILAGLAREGEKSALSRGAIASEVRACMIKCGHQPQRWYSRGREPQKRFQLQPAPLSPPPSFSPPAYTYVSIPLRVPSLLSASLSFADASGDASAQASASRRNSPIS